MRIRVLIAAATLLTGCSAGQSADPAPGALTPVTKSPAASPGRTAPAGSAAGTSATAVSPAAPAPSPGASAAEAVAWVEAAPPADAAEFHVALRGGTTTPLGEDVAFTTTSGTTCMTEVKRAGGLACLVDLRDPPPQPPDAYGLWKGGWVDFDGSGVQVGSGHADPGRFAAGQGMPLPADRSLSFGDFRCRADQTVLVCVNYAHRSAVRYSDDGIDALGCTRQTPPAAGIGIQFSC